MEMVKEYLPDERIGFGQAGIKIDNERTIFSDNLDYLRALENEAKIRLAIACIRERQALAQYAGPKWRRLDETEKNNGREKVDCYLPDILPENATLVDLEGFLKEFSSENRVRTQNSFHHGIELPFESFCKCYGLVPFERTAVLLLFASTIGQDFRNLLDRGPMENWKSEGKGLKIGAILKIITPDFREQLTNRKYFSAEGTLIREEIIIPGGGCDRTTNLLDITVHLHERVVSYILGDKNTYNFCLKGISRDRRPIELERVILADHIKEEILQLAKNYSHSKSGREKLDIDQFYGYGTGLAFLFQGPSGTGKTMLAHALAHRLNKDLLTLNLEEACNASVSFEDAMKYIFREAKLSGGIVFFDECDSFFQEGSLPSRSLLIEIEKSDCITILAANKIDELDPSLDRRITMRVPFYLPDEDQRREMWKASVPPNVALSNDVDFKVLAKKFPLTGGLIKNAIFMALQNSISKNGGSGLSLDLTDIEKAAAYQSASMVNQKGMESIYQPKIGLEDVALRTQDKTFLQRLISVYERFRGKALGMNFVIGSSDIQTGMDCVEGVAKACNLNVKRFSFFNVIYNERPSSSRMEPAFFRKKVSLLDQAFKICPGKHSLILFVNHDLVFQQLIWKDQENPVKELAAFLDKLRSFQGLFFLVTKPIKKADLPIEIHHYIEIKYPPEELQLRQWEFHLKNSEDHQDELVDLVEHYPMHLHEIDFVISQASISASLNGDEESGKMGYILEMIDRIRKRKESPVLFGSKSLEKRD